MPLFGGAVLVFVLVAAALFSSHLDHDVSYYASVGRIVTQGLPLYSGYLEGNPPGPVVLGMASYELSQILGTAFDQTHKYLLLGLQFGAALVTLGILSPVLRHPGLGRWVFSLGLVGAMLALTPETGRREFLATDALIPWSLAVLLAWNGVHGAWPWRLLAGLLAGAAMIFKPHFALIALTVGLADLIRARGRPLRLLPETLLALATCTGLYAWFLLAYPAYLDDIVPLARETFLRYRPGRLYAAQSLFDPPLLLGLAAAAGGALAVRRIDPANPWLGSATLMAVAVGLACAFMVVVQGFGLHYHRLPLNMLNVICLFALTSWALTQGALHRHLRWLVPVALLVAVAITLERSRHFPTRHPRSEITEHPLTHALTPETPGAPILIISSSVIPTGLLLPFLDVQWSGVSAVHWPIPALMVQDGHSCIDNPPPEAVRQALAESYVGRMAERLTELPPELVGIDVSIHQRFCDDRHFDVLAWLRTDPRFDAAWRAAGLQPVGEPINFRNRYFQIYKATPASG